MHVYLCLRILTRNYLFVHFFPLFSPCLLLFTFVYSCLTQFIRACFFIFTRIYQLLHFFTNVYPLLPMFTLVNLCLPMFTSLQLHTRVYLCVTRACLPSLLMCTLIYL